MQDVVDQFAAGQSPSQPANTVPNNVGPGTDGQASPAPQGVLPSPADTASTTNNSDAVSQFAASQPKGPDTNPQDQQTTGPNIAGRAYDTSGAHGMLSLAGDTIKQMGMRPMDLYKQAVDFSQAGDWKNAAEVAFKITMLAATGDGILEKNSPLVKAAESIIMHPIDEARAQAADDRKAGGEWNSVVNSANNLVTGVTKDAKSGDYAGVAGDIAGMADSHVAGAIPLIGPALQQEGKYLDTDLHAHNFGAVAGDILGPLLTLGVGKLIGSTGELSEDAAQGINSAKPGTTSIAGEDVPRAQNHPGNITNSGNFANSWVDLIRRFATPEGAKAFVDEQVAPAAAKASGSNMVDAAVNQVDALRAKRGEPLASADPTLKLDTLDDVQKFLKQELSRQQADDALNAKKNAVLQSAATGGGPAPAPKIQYTAMQNLIDKVQFLNDKVGQAIKDNTQANGPANYSPFVDTRFLKDLPGLFDKQFGGGSFQKMLGKQGVDNYGKVVDAMKPPVTGGKLPGIPNILKWIPHVHALGWKARLLSKALPTRLIADNLLFNPKAGTTALSLYNMAHQLGNALLAGKSAMEAAPVTGPQAETPEAQPEPQTEASPISQTPPSAANVYQNLRGL